MKSINEYVSQGEKLSLISEYLLSKKNNKVEPIPEIGRKAYDWCDEEWTIVDFCCCGEREKLKKFIHDYDDYGQCEADKYNDDDYLVVAENGKYLTIFIWDENSGLHYKN